MFKRFASKPKSTDEDSVVERKYAIINPARWSCISLLSLGLIVFGIYRYKNLEHDNDQVVAGLLAFGALSGIIVSAYKFRRKALLNDYIPTSPMSPTAPDRVSTFGAAVFLIILGFLVITVLAAQMMPKVVISENVGSIVFGLLVFAASITFIVSRLSQMYPQHFSNKKNRKHRPGALARLLSVADNFLVFTIAPMAGASTENVFARYFFAIGHMAFAAYLAWFAPPPSGIFGAIWAALIVFSYSRRWNWLEQRRAEKLRQLDEQAPFDSKSSEDLRDESVILTLLLIPIIPIALRQFELLYPGMFTLENPSDLNLYGPWFGFFGVELLKALPFLDWADIYEATGNTRVSTNAVGSMHVLLVARAILDLVVINVLVQAVMTSVGFVKNRKEFLQKRPGVDRLDDRIERRELTSLVRKKESEFVFDNSIGDYRHYNVKRLNFLKMKSRSNELLTAVIEEIARLEGYKLRPPAEQLEEYTSAKLPSPKAINETIKAVRQWRDFDAVLLSAARRNLNGKGLFTAQREQIAELILEAEAGVDRNQAIIEMVSGRQKDGRSNVRVLAIDALAESAKLYPQNASVLLDVATSDRSSSVKNRAKRALKKFNLVGPAEFKAAA